MPCGELPSGKTFEDILAEAAVIYQEHAEKPAAIFRLAYMVVKDEPKYKAAFATEGVREPRPQGSKVAKREKAAGVDSNKQLV